MLIFLKFGGSLITNKRQPETPRMDVISRLATEVAAARQAVPSLKLVIGNGAGSFGHVPARKYGTRDGVSSSEEWFGYAETADAAARLNRLIVAALLKTGVPAWTVQPSAVLSCTDGKITAGSIEPIGQALLNGLVPVVHGDVSLDSVRGGTIVSTEEIFDWLAMALPEYMATRAASALDPAFALEQWRLQRIVLAGEVDGIYTADPLLDADAKLIPSITPETLSDVADGLGDSHGVDVTGGMNAKVEQALDMITQTPELDVIICSGLIEQNVRNALEQGDAILGRVGTRIYKQDLSEIRK